MSGWKNLDRDCSNCLSSGSNGLLLSMVCLSMMLDC